MESIEKGSPLSFDEVCVWSKWGMINPICGGDSESDLDLGRGCRS